MEILGTLLPVFLVLGLGMLCRRTCLLRREGVEALKKVAVNITLPAVSFSAFAQADYTPRNLLIPLWIFVACCLALALGYGVKRAFHIKSRLYPYLCTGFEGGMLGFSLYPMLHGTLAPFAILDMGHVLFVFTVYKLLLAGPKSAGGFVKEAAASPSLWSLLLGALLGSTGLYAALEPSRAKALLDTVLGYVSAPTSFLILLSIGYDLDFRSVPWRHTLGAMAGRYAVLGAVLALTLGLNRWLLGGAMELDALVLLFLLPAPFVLPVFSTEEKERAFLSSALSMMTLVTLAAFAVMVFLTR